MASRFGAGLLKPQRDPVALLPRLLGVTPPDVAPQLDVLAPVDHDEVEHAVEVQVDERGATTTLESDDASGLRPLDERAVGTTQQEVVRIAMGVVDLGLDVPLGDEQVDEAVVVDVRELGVPRGRWQHVAARVRPLGRDATLEGMSAYVGRASRPTSVCSLLSPWLVMNTSGRPSPVRSWLAMPIPQICSGRQPSLSV